MEKIRLSMGIMITNFRLRGFYEYSFIIRWKRKEILDNEKIEIKPGSVVSIKSGQKHTVIARTELVINEVQIGDEISVEDKTKYEFPEA